MSQDIPSNSPQWATNPPAVGGSIGLTTVQPVQSAASGFTSIQAGFQGASSKPIRQYFNWLFNTIGQWVNFFGNTSFRNDAGVDQLLPGVGTAPITQASLVYAAGAFSAAGYIGGYRVGSATAGGAVSSPGYTLTASNDYYFYLDRSGNWTALPGSIGFSPNPGGSISIPYLLAYKVTTSATNVVSVVDYRTSSIRQTVPMSMEGANTVGVAGSNSTTVLTPRFTYNLSTSSALPFQLLEKFVPDTNAGLAPNVYAKQPTQQFVITSSVSPANGTYVLTVNGTGCIFTASSSTTQQVRDGLVTQINAASLSGVSVSTIGTNQLVVSCTAALTVVASGSGNATTPMVLVNNTVPWSGWTVVWGAHINSSNLWVADNASAERYDWQFQNVVNGSPAGELSVYKMGGLTVSNTFADSAWKLDSASTGTLQQLGLSGGLSLGSQLNRTGNAVDFNLCAPITYQTGNGGEKYTLLTSTLSTNGTVDTGIREYHTALGPTNASGTYGPSRVIAFNCYWNSNTSQWVRIQNAFDATLFMYGANSASGQQYLFNRAGGLSSWNDTVVQTTWNTATNGWGSGASLDTHGNLNLYGAGTISWPASVYNYKVVPASAAMPMAASSASGTSGLGVYNGLYLFNSQGFVYTNKAAGSYSTVLGYTIPLDMPMGSTIISVTMWSGAGAASTTNIQGSVFGMNLSTAGSITLVGATNLTSSTGGVGSPVSTVLTVSGNGTVDANHAYYAQIIAGDTHDIGFFGLQVLFTTTSLTLH